MADAFLYLPHAFDLCGNFVNDNFLITLGPVIDYPGSGNISGFMGYLKGKSAAMMYEQFGDLKYKYRNKEF